MKKAYTKLLKGCIALVSFGVASDGCVRTNHDQYEVLYGPPPEEYLDTISLEVVDTLDERITPDNAE